MLDTLINRSSELMKEQTLAYKRIHKLSDYLITALARGESSQIESLARTGEKELLTMRARLAQIMATLSSFASVRTANTTAKVSVEVKTQFEKASKELISTAELFQKLLNRATALAMNGVSFTKACVETCGIQPPTYPESFLHRGEQKCL